MGEGLACSPAPPSITDPARGARSRSYSSATWQAGFVTALQDGGQRVPLEQTPSPETQLWLWCWGRGGRGTF